MASIHILYPRPTSRAASRSMWASLLKRALDLPGMLIRGMDSRRRGAMARCQLLSLNPRTMRDIGIDRTVIICDAWKSPT